MKQTMFIILFFVGLILNQSTNFGKDPILTTVVYGIYTILAIWGAIFLYKESKEEIV